MSHDASAAHVHNGLARPADESMLARDNGSLGQSENITVSLCTAEGIKSVHTMLPS